MANRYRNQSRRENERSNYGNRWSQSGRGGYGSDMNYERDDEAYFGGGPRYGEGNRTGDSTGNYNNNEDDYTTSSYQSGRGSRDYNSENYGSSLNEYGGGGTYGGYRERRYGNNPPNYGSARSDYGNRAYGGRLNEQGMENERNWLDKAGDEIASWFGDDDAERRRMNDIRGGHRGKGPKNYTRSDDRIREDINDRLTDHDYLDASDIEVEVSNGEVTLTGTVDSRYAKRMAEDLAEEVSGVKNLENRLRVNQNSGSSSFYSNTTQGMPDRVSGSTGMTETETGRGKTA